jgi:hypothetical protein
MDKLDDVFTIRIPSCLKDYIDKMSEDDKHAMNTELRTTMAKHVHLSRFEASLYLTSEKSKNT